MQSGLAIILLYLIVCTALFAVWGWAIIRIQMTKTVLLSLALNLLAIFLSMYADRGPEITGSAFNEEQRHVLALLSTCAILNLGVALLAKIYRAAVMDIATEKEREPNGVGIRAWLSIPNVLAIVAIAIAAKIGFDYSFFVIALLGFCVLLAYPLSRSASHGNPSAAGSPQAPAEERQRVLALVEAGKISAEDAAELLSALAQSQSAARESASSLSGPRRAMALGAAMMLIAFFLPWFTENFTQAMQRMQQAMSQSFEPAAANLTPPQGFSDIPGLAGSPTVRNEIQMSLRGGDVRDGLGWIALAAAISAAALPLFWPTGGRDDRPMRNLTFAILAVGSVAVLYLLSSSLNAVTTIEPGFLLAIAGYAVLWGGAVREHLAQRGPVRASAVAA